MAAPLLGRGWGGVGGVMGGPAPHLHPGPLQKALHGFQLGLGVAALPLRLLQVAGIGLQGVEGPDGVLERSLGAVRMAPITTASGLGPPPQPQGPAQPSPIHPIGFGSCSRARWLPPWPRGDTLAVPAPLWGTPRGRAPSGQGEPPLHRCPLAPRGGTGQPSTRHPPLPGGTRPPMGASGRRSSASMPARRLEPGPQPQPRSLFQRTSSEFLSD